MRDQDGYDWGWPDVGVIAANLDLGRLLQRGGFVGCGYGFTGPEGRPFLALVGENIEHMRAALSLMQTWVESVGPNAIVVEIMFDGPGYILSISHDPHLLRWGIEGLDTSQRDLLLAASFGKRFDSRQRFLEELAEYSDSPIAPVALTVAAVPESSLVSSMGRLVPASEQEILLPGISIYRTREERPSGSMALCAEEVPPKSERSGPPPPPTDSASVARDRERRLAAHLPKTLHVLRHRANGRQLVQRIQSFGCSTWQVEQAICNIRLAEFLPRRPGGKARRSATLSRLRREVVEPASAAFDPDLLGSDVIVRQLFLDTGFLLHHLLRGKEIPDKLEARTRRLRELGYG